MGGGGPLEGARHTRSWWWPHFSTLVPALLALQTACPCVEASVSWATGSTCAMPSAHDWGFPGLPLGLDTLVGGAC